MDAAEQGEPLERAHLLWMRGRFDEARTLVEAALEKVPNDPDAIEMLAQLNQRIKAKEFEQLRGQARREWLTRDGLRFAVLTAVLLVFWLLFSWGLLRAVVTRTVTSDIDVWWPLAAGATMRIPLPLAVIGSALLLGLGVFCAVRLRMSYHEMVEDLDPPGGDDVL